MLTTFILAWRRLRRGWRSGELVVLALAIAVAVATDAGVGAFSARVGQALEESSGDALGADRLLTSRDPVAPDLIGQMQALGLRTARTATMPTVALAGDESSLASLKAVSTGYPLRGALRIADEPLAEVRDTREIPARGEAWADPRLWSALTLARGDAIQIGSATLEVTASLEYEPDRSGSFADLAPRVIVNLEDLAATGLIQPGSRVSFTLQLAGDAAALEAVDEMTLAPGVRRLGLDDARPEIRAALERAGRFLNLAVLAAALLAACAIAISAHRHAQKLRDEVALLKSLGAPSGRIGNAVAASILMLALGASLVGVGIGYVVQLAIGQLLATMLKMPLPPVPVAPMLEALGLGVLMAAGFALPPAMAARHTSPIRVFQRAETGSIGSRSTTLAAVAAVIALLWISIDDWELAGIVLGAAVGGGLAFGGLAWALVAALKPVRARGGIAWRFGLANIARGRGASVAQIVALGLALHSLLLITLGHRDLLGAWEERLKPDAPNQFVVNVQRDQVGSLQKFFAARGLEAPRFMPMARSRLLAINGAPVTAETFEDPEAKDWVNREFNLSWTDELSDDNQITQGQWWGAEGKGQPWISTDEYAIERLGLKLGDRLTMQIADRQIELTVHNFRTVRWDSFRPNFFLLLPTGVIEDAPAQWITSFHLPPGQRSFVRDLVGAYPNVTVLDMDQLMTQVRTLMQRLVQALELLFLFTLAAGLVVLLALMEGTRDQRAMEIAVLRTLGARRRVVVQGLLAEYAVLGLLAGTVGAVLAQAVIWTLAIFVFELPYVPDGRIILAGAAAGTLIVAGLALLSLRRTISTPPRQVMQRG